MKYPVKCSATGRIVPVDAVDVPGWIESGAGELVRVEPEGGAESVKGAAPVIQAVPGEEPEEEEELTEE